MKSRIMALAVLVVAAVAAFAFKAEPIKARGQLWALKAPYTSPFTPQQYELVGAVLPCDLESKVCVIDIPSSDLIASGPNAGFPNVINTAAAGELADDIAVAIGSAGNDPLSQNGRIIYERQ